MALDPKREKILDDWMAVRNAIIKADRGELHVSYIKSQEFEGGEQAAHIPPDAIVGVYVEVALRFPHPIQKDFTDAEIKKLTAAEAIMQGKKKKKKKK